VTVAEANILSILAHTQSVCTRAANCVDYVRAMCLCVPSVDVRVFCRLVQVEALIEKQLVAAVGKVLTAKVRMRCCATSCRLMLLTVLRTLAPT
jgi:hypothetical protein